jgi:hypothetical protein
MQFNHRIPAVLSGQAHNQPVTEQDLWLALLQGVTNPRILRPDLDQVEVRVTGPNCWYRRLVFGNVSVMEELIADEAARRVTQLIAAPEPMAGGRRSVEVEADGKHELYLCFRYDSPHISRNPDLTEAHRAAFRSAYAQADAEQLARLLVWIADNRANQKDRQT